MRATLSTESFSVHNIFYAFSGSVLYIVQGFELGKREKRYRRIRVYKSAAALLKAMCRISDFWYTTEQEAYAESRRALPSRRVEKLPIQAYKADWREEMIGYKWATKNGRLYRLNPRTGKAERLTTFSRIFDAKGSYKSIYWHELSYVPKLDWFSSLAELWANS